MNSILERLTNHFVVNEVIRDEDREIYYYGLYQGFLIIVNIITAIIIGVIFRMVWQSILFMLAYVPLRTYGGGYHAKTEGRCYLISIALASGVLLAIKFILMTDLNILGLTGMGGIIIFGLAPIEDSNKPLNQVEKRVFRIRTRVVLTLQVLIVILTNALDFKEIALVISISIFTLSLMLILGKIRITD
ncbi:accessory gene regulator B family protein [Tissierella carlieri]|jgi:accessory gene regulator B|uniref:Accessory gene regulator B family protein n=1 Tax=Tissierella carlieri TaxID=689904 RepID=A0ABT1S951_9FIRM|nr:accessory gene regulator B family protein [Tissierella carlieri]MBU5311518.1 accessory gene regulator B family protein [Tissierella carlieri]MCQ4922996.1 accessory gene regulator B family protein [Tissierella carlieri]MDU5081959.1 accessory gene regulator B family protein [Bacillota bacterium]